MVQYFLVELEFKRVQTYLFAVPYLKEMIGANTLLGETIRGVWSSKYKAFMNFSSKDLPEEKQFQKENNYESIDNLPALAQNCGSLFPELNKKLTDRNGYKELASIIFNKKQEDKFKFNDSYQDDVLEVAENTGILVRDGGHFEAIFPDEAKATKFITLATGLLSRKLPGLILESRCNPLEETEGKLKLDRTYKNEVSFNSECIFDLPQFEDCEYSGNEPAVKVIEYSDEKENVEKKEKLAIGESSYAKQIAAKRFYNKTSKDVLGMLNNSFIKELLLTKELSSLEELSSPDDFKEIGKFSEGHIAVIHADGNDVGKRLRSLKKTYENDDYIDEWLGRESFFYSIRSGVRTAFLKSIKFSIKELKCVKNKKYLLMPLMLGGDDILIVTPASIAFDFVSDLANNIKESTLGIPSNEGEENPLTIGAGILICSSSFPFYKACELSEELATSAKKLKTVYPDHSYVDWEILSESWHSGIAETRAKQYVSYKNGETLLFSGKPYVISNSQKNCVTLENIINAAKNLKNDTARNQFKYLYERIPDGRHKLKLLFDELPNDMKKRLEKELNFNNFDCYERMGNKTFLTRVGDLIEIMETRRRGDKNE